MTNDEIIGCFRSRSDEPEACNEIRTMVIDFAMEINERLDDNAAVWQIMHNLDQILAIGLQAATCNT